MLNNAWTYENLAKIHVLFLPQGANIQNKSTFKTKSNQKDWQKLSFPTPIWKNPNYEHKTLKRVKDYLRDVNGMKNNWIQWGFDVETLK